MTTNLQTLRAEYAAIRTISGMSAKSFNEAVSRYAHECADGEAVTPACWVQGARWFISSKEGVTMARSAAVLARTDRFFALPWHTTCKGILP